MYELTNEADSIKVILAHPIISVKDDGIDVTWFRRFSNEGDKVYTGPEIEEPSHERTVLAFDIPEDALTVTPDPGMTFIGNKLVTSQALPPGITEISYSYRLARPDSDSYDLPLFIGYTTDSIRVMVQGAGLDVNSDHLSSGEIMNAMGQEAHTLTGESLASDDIIEINIGGLSDSESSDTWIIVIIVVVILVAIGVLSFFIIRGRSAGPADHVDIDTTQQQRERLLQEIASLDDDFEAGRISEDDYQRERSEKKDELLKLMRDQDV